MDECQRFLVISCDGLVPAVLSHHDHEFVGVMEKGVLVATTAAAKAVPIGVSSARAHGLAPSITLVERDRWREQRAKMKIVATLEAVSPSFRIHEDTLAAPLRAMLRYFGSEEAVREATHRALLPERARWPSVSFAVTIADSLFTAQIFKKTGRTFPPGTTREFMAKLPVEAVFPEKMAQLCRRVGLRTVGSVTDLTPAVVSARFGGEGLTLFRLARLEQDLPFEGSLGEIPVCVEREVQDGEGFDSVVFTLARELESAFSPYERKGLRAQEVDVELQDLKGQLTRRQLSRVEGVTVRQTLAVIRAMYEAMRIRGDGLCRMDIMAGRWQPEQRSQLSFEGHELRNAHIVRALDRVVALVGDDNVRVACLSGGRLVGGQVVWEPWTRKWPSPARKLEGLPWPGHLPVAPAVVYDSPVRVEVIDRAGRGVVLEAPGVVMEYPAALVWGGNKLRVMDVRGPWPIVERWWESRSRRCVVILVQVEGAMLHVLRYQQGRWWLDASFD